MTQLKVWLPFALTVVMDLLGLLKDLPAGALSGAAVTVVLLVLTAAAAAIPAVEAMLSAAHASAERIAGKYSAARVNPAN